MYGSLSDSDNESEQVGSELETLIEDQNEDQSDGQD